MIAREGGEEGGTGATDVRQETEYRHAAVRVRDLPTLVWGPWGGPMVAIESAEVIELRKSVEQARSELRQSQADLRQALLNLEGNEVEYERKLREAQTQREARA